MKRLLKSMRGAASVEYGILVAFIAVVIITAVTLLGSNLQGVFQHIADAIKIG